MDSHTLPSVIAVTLRVSKTDQFGEGTTIFISKTGTALCPVAAILAYLVRRATGDGPLFLRDNGLPQSRAYFVCSIRNTLAEAGLDVSRYSRHSFWIGVAKAASQAGLSDSMIQLLGRWRSSAFLSYIQIPAEHPINMSSTIAGWTPPNTHPQTS